MKNQQQACQLLKIIAQQGTHEQQQEARRLLDDIAKCD